MLFRSVRGSGFVPYRGKLEINKELLPEDEMDLAIARNAELQREANDLRRQLEVARKSRRF